MTLGKRTRSLVWGLGAGLIAATGLGFGPVIVVGLLTRSLQEFEEVGGVGSYLAWAYTAGVLGGLTVGLLRPVVRSPIAQRTASGIVAAEVFALQPLLLGMEGVGDVAVIAAAMGAMAFVFGFAFGPRMIAGFKRSWPEPFIRWGAPR